MKRLLLIVLFGLLPARAEDDLSSQLLTIKRVYVDRLTGGETAAQMRDLIISSLQGSKLFILTENQERADFFLRGAAEDLIYTDDFESSDSLDVRGGGSASTRSGRISTSVGSTTSPETSHSINLSAGEKESSNIKERKH